MKADESGSLHTEVGHLRGNKQLMESRWGAGDERRNFGCRWMDSGRQRWQNKEEGSGC